MGFTMESQELKELSFFIFYEKIKCKDFHQKKKKKCKIPHFCTLFPKFGQKLIFHKNWLVCFSTSINPYLHAKK